MKIGVFEILLRGKRKDRRFTAAQQTRLIDWTLGWTRINGQLKQDYCLMVQRARDLAQNNEFVTGYLESLERNVIGPNGFRLQSLARGVDGAVDQAAAKRIRELWEVYQSEAFCYVSADERSGGREFDVLILSTLTIDGEVFIRRLPDPNSPFGVRYDVLDSLDVDYQYNAELANGERIVMGIRIDARNRPLSYFVREQTTDFYQTGRRVELPASEIIHLFRKRFPGQVRGITRLAATVLNIAQLDAYKEAEIIAAKLQAANCAVYEQTGTGGDLDDDADENGDVMREMAPGMIGIAPKGRTLKQITPNHPNSNFGTFVKSILRGVANSLGNSYNRATGDYESVNYSSLKAATLEDIATFETLQMWMVAKWKNPQFAEFLRNVLLFGELPFGFRRLPDLMAHKFYAHHIPCTDLQKEMAGKKIEYELMRTDPITEIEAEGRDPVELLDNWARFNAWCAERGLRLTIAPITTMMIDESTEDKKGVANES